jgi:hypothetical protein
METRGAKYGRNLAVLVCFVLEHIPSEKRIVYKRDFLDELQSYSLAGRKKGMPPGGGCVCELESIEKADLRNPREFAKLIKEGIHLMYQKRTSARVLYALLENL